MDKLEKTFGCRITETLKDYLKILPPEWMNILRQEIRLTMARTIHNYLGSNPEFLRHYIGEDAEEISKDELLAQCLQKIESFKEKNKKA